MGASKEDAAVEARALALILAGLAARRVVDTGDIQVRHLHCRCCPAPHKLLALAVTLPRQRRVALAGHPNTVKSLVADLMRGLDAARPN